MMANVLKMAILESILSLHAQHWSQRRIARELGVDRDTVRKYLRQRLCGAKPANLPTGSAGSKPATLPGAPAPPSKPATNLPTGSDDAPTGESAGPEGAVGAWVTDVDPAAGPTAGADSAIAPMDRSAGSTSADERPLTPSRPAGPQSRCEPYRDVILAKMAQDLSAVRIWQDLVADGAAVGYDSVRRFVQRLGRQRSLPFRRMECAAGEEAQVDFGSGATIVTPDGKRRKSHVLRIVLSHSRKGYSEATYTQTTDDFLRALENAFAHFGGVPQTLVIDNLKAAVAHPDWFDPELVPKVQAFCRHYGTVILPTRPYMPRHKGKVESGVKYVKNNALKGRTFASLQEEQEHLARWERTVADLRIHGTTKRQVAQVFQERERGALLPLPRERFASFQEAQRKVHRDGHVEVAKAYYSVPPEYLARQVWVRWDARLVRIFNQRFEQIAIHVRHEPGAFSTHGEHLAPEKIHGLERGAEHLLGKVRLIGPQTYDWAQAMLTARGVEGTRVLQGLLALTRKHASETLENACKTALSHGSYRLRTIRQLLQRRAGEQQQLPFLDEHPLIRPLDDYASIVTRAWQRQAPEPLPSPSRERAPAIHRREDRSSLSEGFQRHGWTETPAQQQSRELAELRAHHESLRPSLDWLTGAGSSDASADVSPPRLGYPSSGCASAEPDSVSPDDSTLVRSMPSEQTPLEQTSNQEQPHA